MKFRTVPPPSQNYFFIFFCFFHTIPYFGTPTKLRTKILSLLGNDSFFQSITYFFQKVFCGHEYSIQNLTFGNHVEPENEAIKAKLDWCQSMRNANPAQPTIPSTIGK